MPPEATIPKDEWDLVVEPKSSLFSLNFKEVWRYKDLLLLMVRRDFVAYYKQTILGPIWFFLQPLLTTAMYFLIFFKVAKLSTDDVPPMLFYLAGVTVWNYFSESLTKTSDTFIANAAIFGKVYFPRLVIPISIVVSNLMRLGIQFMLFLVFWVYYLLATNAIHPHWDAMLLLPILILLMACLSLGLGIILGGRRII
ncbi:MAG TPA: ABC transporter permease, partial [Chitinophagaceae bacterium]|nr:ABC transporter permease [Chitinophagaceae bacterium]